jgi:hypothetical protein
MLVGAVYLLHSDRTFWGPMQHYLTYNVPQRLQGHREGSSCVTTSKAFDQLIGFTLARVWEPGSLRLERQIKAARGRPNYCPLCPRRPRAAVRARRRSPRHPSRTSCSH